MTHAAHLKTLLEAPRPEHFTPDFLAQVKFEQLQPYLAGLQTRYGAIREVQLADEEGFWTVNAERGQYQVLARLNDALQITSLRIPTPSMPSLQAKVLFGALWALPLILLGTVVRSWAVQTRLEWLTTLVPSVMFISAFLATLVWAQASTYLRPLFWLCLAAVFASAVRLPALPTGSLDLWSSLFALGVSLAFGRLLLEGLKGRRAPGQLVTLGPVLAGGAFMVGQGGSTSTVNYHVDHPTMRYAVDLIGVGPLGRHARGHLPADPARYAIFGAQVLAPLVMLQV
ncbi:hypothetical protein LAJ19_16295 (plasmid) [Deinococcus taeanensis]|uniref:hypothetical protein n=1 Tax=Deinococcus taeanensis TaxID=2737050 RepID=UPI001CDB6D68|nr:hypothetical protein [Deinococcus taeanensis]UBV44716.1 hypothetical protein LAJ19_16295 [Deinococcus taeanensis]